MFLFVIFFGLLIAGAVVSVVKIIKEKRVTVLQIISVSLLLLSIIIVATA